MERRLSLKWIYLWRQVNKMNEHISKLKKDFIVLYLARNGIMTFIITLLSMSYDLSHYYQISFINGIEKIFSNSIFTWLYFMLIWVFNYLIFEIYKIISDAYRNKFRISFKIKCHRCSFYLSIIIMIGLILIVVMSPLVRLFKVDLINMFVFMILRSFKELIKNRL